MIPRAIVANTRAVRRDRILLAGFAVLTAACGSHIGDSCSTNVDCAQDGTRDCDLSQPGGYCTVNGCDEYSCPDSSVCVRIFPYEAEGQASCDWLASSLPASGPVCSDDQATNDAGASCVCPSDQICLPDGHCAPRLSERRFCEAGCGSDGDCRGGYVCREAGVEGTPATGETYGSIALVAYPHSGMVVKFCAPAP